MYASVVDVVVVVVVDALSKRASTFIQKSCPRIIYRYTIYLHYFLDVGIINMHTIKHLPTRITSHEVVLPSSAKERHPSPVLARVSQHVRLFAARRKPTRRRRTETRSHLVRASRVLALVQCFSPQRGPPSVSPSCACKRLEVIGDDGRSEVFFRTSQVIV